MSGSYFMVTLEGFFERKNDFVHRFANRMYEENRTVFPIYEAQRELITDLDETAKSTFRNTFIVTADIEGIADYERILGIVPDVETESMELRRGRIINKLMSLPPFTMSFLENKLTAIFGESNWFIEMDYFNLRMVVDIYTSVQGLFEQTIKDLKTIIPANILFEPAAYPPYTYRYLERYFSYEQLAPFTYAELSQYSDI